MKALVTGASRGIDVLVAREGQGSIDQFYIRRYSILTFDSSL